MNNSTDRLIQHITRSNYFADERAILDSHRLLLLLVNPSTKQLRAYDLLKHRFILAAERIDVNVIHLVEGMLGIYQYGGDILQATADYVQVMNVNES